MSAPNVSIADAASSDMVDVSPSPSMLESELNSNLGWVPALCELIDNCFDANANAVSITVDSKTLTIRDDGDGCADPLVMIAQGKRIEHGTNKSGRYGVGAKHALLYFGGTVRIQSVRDGVVRTVTVNWKELAKLERWSIPRGSSRPAEKSERGTTITINFSGRRPLPINELAEKIGYSFSPALKQYRKQIVISSGRKSIVAVPFELPPLDNIIDKKLIIEGKGAHVKAGIVREGVVNKKPGLIYYYGFRIILEPSGLGCSDGERSHRRISGVVLLDKKWALTKHKDDIRSNEKEILGVNVLGVVSDLLDKSAHQSMIIENEEIIAGLNSRLRQDELVFGDGELKEKRKRTGEHVGTATPGTGETHRVHPTVIQTGTSLRKRARAGGLRIDLLCADKDSVTGKIPIGRVDFSGRTIWLSSNHPLIQKDMQTAERDLCYFAAKALLANAKTTKQPGHQEVLFAKKEPTFEALLGALFDSTVPQVTAPETIQ